VEVYELVRRAVLVDGKSRKQTALDFGIDERTVKKMFDNPVPPGYRLSKPRAKPKLGAFVATIDEILLADQAAPRKQRHTAKRIFERLRDEHGYTGGQTQVRACVADVKGRRPKEAFVPLVSIPGEAEVDFYEACAEIGGVMRKAHCFLVTQRPS
jgi:transposase